MHVPDFWLEVNPTSWSGPVLVLGGTDTGESTVVRVFYEALQEASESTGIIDGDLGESPLGPPTTLAAALLSDNSSFPRADGLAPRFVGAPTSRGHMLESVEIEGRALSLETQTRPA